jgi:Ca2+-binding RTX toxin-like protein
MGSSSGPSVEPLESRVLMAVTAHLSQKGRLTLTGDDTPNVVLVMLVNGRRDIQISVNGVLIDPNPRGGSPDSVRRTRVRRVVADMGAADDEVRVGNRDNPVTPRFERNRLYVRCTMSGGEGNDTLMGGPLDDLIIGGPGDDILFGDRGEDLVLGSSGNDQIFGEGGRDNLVGQDGDDRLDGGGNEDILYGMRGADHLIGGEDDDFVNAAPGPGDTTDRNEKPSTGEHDDVFGYVDQLIDLAVPDRFRAAAKS